ncbi:MAG: DMT family transporter [bacterium]|nr:DMT family transporter [bacterium]
MNAERRGDIFIVAGALLWGLFPVITILSLRALPALSALGWTAAFAALFFAFIMSVRHKWKEVLDRVALVDILWTTFFIGILYYLFTFFGLTYTSAGNASIIALIEIFFTYALFNVWHRESMPRTHIMGSLLMILGAAIILYPNTTAWNPGDFLIVAAAAVAPFGNYFQRRARKRVSSETIMFVRSAVSAFCILLLAGVLGERPLQTIDTKVLLLLVVNGIVLLGVAKIFWIEGIHRISVTKANAWNSIAPAVTLLVAYIILDNVPTVWQLSAFVPMFLGIVLLGGNNQKSKPSTAGG